MARAVSEVKCFINTDKDGNPVAPTLWTYRVTDGAASKNGNLVDEAPDFGKTFHNAGTAGEFWRDGVDAIKAAEGI